MATGVNATRSEQGIAGRAFLPLLDVPQMSTTSTTDEINVRRKQEIGELGHVVSKAFWTLCSC